MLLTVTVSCFRHCPAGTFGVVLHAELRGSAVALKSLRTSSHKSLSATAHGTASLSGHGSSDAGGKAPGGSLTKSYMRSKAVASKAGFFSFIDTAYSQVEDKERQGLLRLKRAFQQASRTVLENELNARQKESEKE